MHLDSVLADMLGMIPAGHPLIAAGGREARERWPDATVEVTSG